MRPIVACFLLCLVLLQLVVANMSRTINIFEAVAEETASSERIPGNFGSDFTSDYLYHPPIEAKTCIGFSDLAFPIFDFDILTAGVTFVELRPPDRWFA